MRYVLVMVCVLLLATGCLSADVVKGDGAQPKAAVAASDVPAPDDPLMEASRQVGEVERAVEEGDIRLQARLSETAELKVGRSADVIVTATNRGDHDLVLRGPGGAVFALHVLGGTYDWSIGPAMSHSQPADVLHVLTPGATYTERLPVTFEQPGRHTFSAAIAGILGSEAPTFTADVRP